MIVQFKLSRYFLRPVITVNCGGEEYPALIDTGAVVPVFTFGQEKIAEIGGRSLYRTTSFGGFGGLCRGELYRVDIDLGVLKYVDLPIICAHNANMPFAFIFPATMFTGFSYTIDDAARTLTVDTRTNETDLRLRIYDGTGEFRVLVGSAKSGDQSET